MTKLPPAHPFLFAIYPILFVWSSDITYRYLSEILWPACGAVGTALSMLLILNRFFAWDMRKAGIWVSFFMCMFFSYWVSHRLSAMSNYFFLPIWSLVLILGTVAIAMTRRPWDRLTGALNIMGCLLVLFPLLSLVHNSTGAASTSLHYLEAIPRNSEAYPGQVSTAAVKNRGSLPNIYYIILDAYGRTDVLKDTYQFDNGSFLAWLSQKGFYVAVKSNANYCLTPQSLACSLNYGYLDSQFQSREYDTRKLKLVREIIRTNRITSVLKAFGYKTVAFGTGYSATELRTADSYVAPFPQVSELAADLLAMTPLYAVHYRLFNTYGLGNDFHRRRLSLTFDNLTEAAKGEGPFFVFCHLITPHPPFVFDEDGRAVDPKRPFSLADGSHWHKMDESLQAKYRFEYRRQIQFVNTRIKAAIEKIIATSNGSAIIILQSDHGPRSGIDWDDCHAMWSDVNETMGILNAYYVPGRVRKFLYPEISPVNSFRIILKHCFGVPLELLPDKSFFCSWSNPFEWTEVTERVRHTPAR